MILSLSVNVNQKVYHMTLNLFTSCDSELVYHLSQYDSQKVYHLNSNIREHSSGAFPSVVSQYLYQHVQCDKDLKNSC